MNKAPAHPVLTALIILLAWLPGRQPRAAEVVDSAAFYARHPGQLFRDTQPVDMTVGFIEGQETPYQTWEGLVAGKKVYVELHGTQLKVKVGPRWIERSLQGALRMPAEAMTAFDARGTELYVQAGVAGRPTALCLESLQPGAQQAVPFRSVYVVPNLLAAYPRLYQLPALYAACKGLAQTQGRPGEVETPVWTPVGQNKPTGFSIRYHRLVKRGFMPTGMTFSAVSVGDQLDEFRVSKP